MARSSLSPTRFFWLAALLGLVPTLGFLILSNTAGVGVRLLRRATQDVGGPAVDWFLLFYYGLTIGELVGLGILFAHLLRVSRKQGALAFALHGLILYGSGYLGLLGGIGSAMPPSQRHYFTLVPLVLSAIPVVAFFWGKVRNPLTPLGLLFLAGLTEAIVRNQVIVSVVMDPLANPMAGSISMLVVTSLFNTLPAMLLAGWLISITPEEGDASAAKTVESRYLDEIRSGSSETGDEEAIRT